MRRTDALTRTARAARRSSGSFPRLTWATCECGCGWEGEDEVTQWLIEEAAFSVLDELDERRRLAKLEQEATMQRLREGALRALGRHQE